MPRLNRHISYWLMPTGQYAGELVGIIGRLAEEYEAPRFPPHVTIYSGPGEEAEAQEVLDEAVRNVSPIKLAVRGLDYSPVFFKTLFAAFHGIDELDRLSEDLRKLSPQGGEYDLQPHLSLIYKRMDPETQHHLARTISIEGTEVEFDWVKAVSIPASAELARDVAQWRDVARADLHGR